MGKGEEKVDLIARYLGVNTLPNIDLDAVLVKCMQDSTEFLFYVSCDEMKGYDIFVRIKWNGNYSAALAWNEIL